MSEDICARIERLRREIHDLLLPVDAWEHDLRPGPSLVSGRVEDYGYLLPPFDALALKIDGGWLKVTHKQLREAMWVLRPQVGEEIVVEFLGRPSGTNSEYTYEVCVGERFWSGVEEDS